MKTGFQNLPFQVSTFDGRNFIALQPIDYIALDGTQYRIPIGATSDGASTPPILWEKFNRDWIPPFGSYWPAAYLHDAAYRNSLLFWNGASFVTAALPKDKCDSLLLESMDSLGTHDITKEEIYKGVVAMGTCSFATDRATTA